MADEARKGIDATNAHFAEYVKTKQFDKIADLYTEDCTLMFAGKEPRNGRKEIDEFAKTKLPSFGDMFYEENQYFELMNETTAFSIDLWSSKDAKGTFTELCNCTVTWKKKDGKWLYDREFINRPALPKSEVQKQLDARLEELFTAWAKEDYETAASIYTEDAICMPDKLEPVVGRKALLKYFIETMPQLQPMVAREIYYCELLNDNRAHSNGGAKCFDNNGKIIKLYSDCLLWKKIDGQWYLFIDSFFESPVPSN